MDLTLPGDLILPASLWIPAVMAAALVLGVVVSARIKLARMQLLLDESEVRARRVSERTVDVDAIRKEEETRARTRSESETHHLQATSQAFRDLVTSTDRRDLAQHLAHWVKRILGPSQWMVFVASGSSSEEFLLAAGGCDVGEIPPLGFRLTAQMGRLGLVARRRSILDVRDFDSAPPIVKDQMDANEPKGFQVHAAAPVVVGDTVVALISVGGLQGSLAGSRAALELLAECTSTVVRGLDTRERARKLENCDELTGLYNKSFFCAHGAERVYENRTDGVEMAVLRFAVDDHVGYADRNGHQRGDKLIRAMAGSVRPLFRERDLLARWGAAEFVALLPGVDQKLVFTIAERMRRAIGTTEWPGGKSQPGGRVTLSVGLAVCPGDGDTFDELMNAAERNLVTARRQGGNCSVVTHHDRSVPV